MPPASFLARRLLLLAAAGGSLLPTLAAPAAAADRWVHLDTPLWDIADEGLPLRFTYSLASPLDPLARVLHARETRWTLSTGYARVYDSYDPATRIFKNPGGHAALFGAGRQFRWPPPAAAGAAAPALAIELGLQTATRRFPADGTSLNVKLITGVEWSFPRGSRREWSVGLMWLHFSNANLFSRNAGYDGLALRFGRQLGSPSPR